MYKLSAFIASIGVLAIGIASAYRLYDEKTRVNPLDHFTYQDVVATSSSGGLSIRGKVMSHDGRFVALRTDKENENGEYLGSWITVIDMYDYSSIVELH